MYNKSAKSGFTMVELSVVLVVIGLIVVGVLGGIGMARNSQLKRVFIDAKKHETSVRSFKDKYNAYPGDLVNASSYWSGAVNGNGNGKIEFLPGGLENYHVWRHLKYSGISAVGVALDSEVAPTTNGSLGVDTPESSVTSVGYWVEHLDKRSEGTFKHLNLFGKKKTVIIAAVPNTSSSAGGSPYNTLLPEAFLTSIEAELVDAKYDNGFPKSGVIQSAPNNSSAANTCYLDASDTYSFSGALNASKKACYWGFAF